MPSLIPWQATKFQEVLEWKTDVATKFNGSEELTRIRNLPRQSFNVELKVPNSDIRRCLDLLESGIRENNYLPIWSEVTVLNSVADGSTNLLVTTANFDYRPDWACIWSSSEYNQLLSVSAVNSNSIYISTPTLAYETCVLMPAREFEIIGNIKKVFNGLEWFVSFEAFVINSIEIESSASSTQFKGEDVLLDQRFKASTFANGAISKDQDILDFELGRIYSKTNWDRTKLEFPHYQLLSGSSNIKAAKRWLYRRGGKSRCFWAPTQEDDVRILAITNGGLTISVSPNCAPKNASRHIAIRRTDGSWECREILSTNTSGGIFLTLDQAVNSDLSTIELVSWLVRLRLDSDRIEIQYGFANSAIIDLNLIESWSGSDEPLVETFLWLDGLVGEINSPYPTVLDPGIEEIDWSQVTLYDYETP